jgi:glutamate/aspartate transport system substrate-binding protein
MLLAGEFDMECGSTTITAQRQQRVAFSKPIFYTSHRVALRAGTAAIPDRMLRISGIEGSTSQTALHQMQQDGWHFEFHGQPSIGQAFDAYRFDPNLDGLVADEVILASLLSQPSVCATIVLNHRLGREAYGFMLRQGDRELISVVDETLNSLMDSISFRQQLIRWLPRSTHLMGAHCKPVPLVVPPERPAQRSQPSPSLIPPRRKSS